MGLVGIIGVVPQAAADTTISTAITIRTLTRIQEELYMNANRSDNQGALSYRRRKITISGLALSRLVNGSSTRSMNRSSQRNNDHLSDSL